MTHREMIAKLGLTEAQYRDLMANFLTFCRTLDDAQKRVVRHNMPKLEEAARSLGPDVSVEDFQKFCGPEIGACGLGCWGEGDDEL